MTLTCSTCHDLCLETGSIAQHLLEEVKELPGHLLLDPLQFLQVWREHQKA